MTNPTVDTVSGSGAQYAGIRWGLAQDTPPRRRRGPRVVAVASSCGERVDRSFEDAGEFYLYETSPSATTFIGRQPCACAQPGAVARLLRDCDLVLCAGIGAQCRQLLDGLGVCCRLEYAGQQTGQALAHAGGGD